MPPFNQICWKVLILFSKIFYHFFRLFLFGFCYPYSTKWISYKDSVQWAYLSLFSFEFSITSTIPKIFFFPLSFETKYLCFCFYCHLSSCFFPNFFAGLPFSYVQMLEFFMSPFVSYSVLKPRQYFQILGLDSISLSQWFISSQCLCSDLYIQQPTWISPWISLSHQNSDLLNPQLWPSPCNFLF